MKEIENIQDEINKGSTGIFIDSAGDLAYLLNGKYHREDGPAVEMSSGTKKWYINDKLHREDGPAIEYTNGDKSWYFQGRLHRLDGKAIEWRDGEYWHYYGKETKSEKEFYDPNWRKAVEIERFL